MRPEFFWGFCRLLSSFGGSGGGGGVLFFALGCVLGFLGLFALECYWGLEDISVEAVFGLLQGLL